MLRWTLLLIGLLPAALLLSIFETAAAQPAGEGNAGGTPVAVSPEVARSAERGLAWLAEQQLPAGAWTGAVGVKMRESYGRTSDEVPHVGVTALAGMALLAGGHVPGRGRYSENLQRALDYLLERSNDFGFISAHGTRMYSHAFATLFLAEVYGMVGTPEVEETLSQAVDLIASSQNNEGSWRYQPFAWQSDMSITVCQLMALRAARNVGINVPISAIDAAVGYVRRSLVENEADAWFRRDPVGYYASAPGAFRYQVYGDHRSSFALTAAGVTSLYHAGEYDRAVFRRSLSFLEETQRLVSQRWVGHYFYFYGHYYAVQAMFLVGNDLAGEDLFWQLYWRRVSTELLRHQQADGSWENHTGPGDAFGTAVACFVLQTPYGYLPILQR